MEQHQDELILTGALLLLLVIVRIIIARIVVKRILSKNFDRNRKKVISKAANLLLFLAVLMALASVWSLDPSEVVLFISSVLTVIGVAFFAQWSHLSNITAGIIIFFDSTIKIGDTITILDKDFPQTGKIEDIEALFLKLRTPEGELITIPNNTLLQKSIRIEHDKKAPQKDPHI